MDEAVKTAITNTQIAEQEAETLVSEAIEEKTEAPAIEQIEEPVTEQAELPVAEPIAEPAAEPVVAPAEEQSEEAKPLPLDTLGAEELCQTLALDIQNMPISALRTRVEQIKVAFYRHIRTADEAAKAKFVEAGGAADEYKAEVSEIEKRFKELLTIFRDKRDKFAALSEEQKEANYKAKLAIIEELKALVDSTETLGQTFAAFRELQTRWKEIGIVPIAATKDLWETYHHHTENFYNFVKINKELRDLDLKRNYEAKIAICEEAEALGEIESAVSAFNELQKLHDRYREAGPVVPEFKEQLWERFKTASSRINKRHQDHFDSQREEQERNLALKAEICVKVEEFGAAPHTSSKEWNEAQDAITELQKVWKTIGFAPRKDNNAIYERFRAACDKFFEAKRAFFGGLRSEMDDNLQAKTDLCVQAEALSQSEDWKETTALLLDLQKRWKEIGTVSRKHSDIVWKRFRAACDKFFERKGEHFKESDTQFGDNLTAKQAIIEELKALEGSAELSFDKLKEVMGRFSAIGFVPIKQKETVAKAYKTICDTLFDSLRSAEGGQRIERFKDKISTARSGGQRVGGGEREKLVGRLRSLEADVKLLENNIGFFANSKNAGALIADVERKIEHAKTEIAEVKEKIKIFDKQ